VERGASVSVEPSYRQIVRHEAASPRSYTEEETCSDDNLTTQKAESRASDQDPILSEDRKTKPASFKQTVNCWLNFIRKQAKLRDNRKLKHNITQTLFRGLKDTIKHLEAQQDYSSTSKFTGAASKTRSDKVAWRGFKEDVRPFVAEVFTHFNKTLHYNRANISFCQKERMKALELDSSLRAYIHYIAFVFYDLNPRRLEDKFNVTYTGSMPLNKVWLAVKTYYAFSILLDEVCLTEAALLRLMHEEGLFERFADALRVYRDNGS
jgi:hypothetical protein